MEEAKRLRCPACGSHQTRSISRMQTSEEEQGWMVRRQYRCDSCGGKFQTVEIVDAVEEIVTSSF